MNRYLGTMLGPYSFLQILDPLQVSITQLTTNRKVSSCLGTERRR